MNSSDIGTIGIIYAICAAFLYMTLDLAPAARIYPLCLIAGLAILNSLYLFRCLIRLRGSRAAGEAAMNNDFAEVFRDFLPGQFFFVVISCIAYVVALFFLGFYISSVIYLLVSMWFLKVKLWQLAVSVLLLASLIYCVFTLFLKVPLPKGMLFS